MSATKHTPGPWEHLGQGDIVTKSLPTCDGDGFFDVATVYLTSNDMDMANARLIASAPDLLAVVARLVREEADGQITIGCIEDARTALAKATGGAL